MKYFVYIVECSDKTLYCGWTNNLEKRLLSHNTLKSGAKYTRGRRPVILSYFEIYKTKNQAMSREVCIKKMTRKKKLDIILSESGKNKLSIKNKFMAKGDGHKKEKKKPKKVKI